MAKLVDAPDLGSGVEIRVGSSPTQGTINRSKCMKTNEVLDRAYGHIPRDCTPNFDISILPVYRGFRYHWLIFLRKFLR